MYFPTNYNESPTQKEKLLLLRKRSLLVLDNLCDGTDISKQLKEIDDKINDLQEVILYQQYEIENDKGFEACCLALTETMHKDAKNMTLMEYETAVDVLKTRHEDYEKNKSKRK
jgi:hypothetical protein